MDVVESLSLEMFKKPLDVVLKSMISWATLVVGGQLDWVTLEVFSNLGWFNDSMIPWFYDNKEEAKTQGEEVRSDGSTVQLP